METPLPKYLLPITAPLSFVYSTAIHARNFLYNRNLKVSHKLSNPTISIGGIRAGGVGKTPVAQMIGRYLVDKCDCAVAYLSRGYGREMSDRNKTIIVPPLEKISSEKISAEKNITEKISDEKKLSEKTSTPKITWSETGDEPWMLHQNVPEAWLGIDTDRVRAAAALAPLLPTRAAFVLDDGFQHRRVRRDLDVVCLGESTFDDGMLPHGYLREPISALERAHVALIIGAEDRIKKLKEVRDKVLKMRKNSIKTAILLQHTRYFKEARSGKICENLPLASPVIITGIARPERFLEMPLIKSLAPAAVMKFKDHHKFKKNNFDAEHDIYLGNGVLTTEKDAVRLLGDEFAEIPEIWFPPLELKFFDGDEDFFGAIHYIIDSSR